MSYRSLILSFFVLPAFAYADYNLMAPMATMPTTVNLADYVQGAFRVLIGVAGVLAVVMIVWCGIELMGNPSVAKKGEAKKCITNALVGVLLAAASWIILNTISSQLVSNDLNLGNTALIPSLTPPAATPPPGSFAWSATAGICPKVAGKIVSIVPPSSCAGGPPFAGAVCCAFADAGFTPPPTPPLVPPPPPKGIPPPPPATLVNFFPSTYKVSEGFGSVTITVVRTSGTGAGTVDYSTADANAISGSDYVGTSGTLVFAAGETTKTFTVTILDDAIVETVEHLSLRLTNATGDIGLGMAASGSLEIDDDDTGPPPPLPDVTPPVVTITSPINDRATTSPIIHVKFKASDDREIYRLSWSYGPPFPGTPNTVVFCTATCTNPVDTTIQIPIDLTAYGPQQLSIDACDRKNCVRSSVYVIVQAPCVDSPVLSCKAIPVGKNPVMPLCEPAAGKSGYLVGVNTHAYAFKLTSASGGGRIYVTGGFENEYPPPHPLEARTCAPSLCDSLPLDPSCTCTYGTAVTGSEGDYLYCTNDVPVNLAVSISDTPGDLSSGTSSVPQTLGKSVSGNCGTSRTGARDMWTAFISTTPAPGACVVQVDRTYYLNISTIPFSAASKGSNEYSLFWDFSPL